jgi:outer membrane protein
MKQKLSVLVVALSLFAFAGIPYAQALKVGFVDAQKVLENSKEGKKMKLSLEEYVKGLQKVIDLEEQELKQMEDELTQKGALLSPEAKKMKQDEFQKKLVTYQKKASDLNKDVQGKKLDSLREFNRKLEHATQKIAEKGAYTMVLDRSPEGSGVIYASDTYDVTSQVIEQVDLAAAK